MGMLWELHQQNTVRRGAQVQASLDDRMAALEQRIAAQDEVIGQLIQRLEATLGEDLNGDGLVTRAAGG